MIAESDLTYEQMRDLEKTHRCGICGSLLTTAWGGSLGVNSYILRCSQDVTHTGITRHNNTSELEINKIKKEFKLDSNSLMKMPEKSMLARIDMAKFPKDLSLLEKKLLAQVAISYGFDPLMGEVSIYQGRPYVSIDGRYRAAQETGKLNGVNTRPSTKQEREDWKIPDGDYFFCAEVFVKGADYPFIGWGRVYQPETVGGKGFTPVEKNPQRMAEKRAEAQALRKAFHIPLPSIEDIGSPEDTADKVIDVKVSPGPVWEDEAFKVGEPLTESNHLLIDPTTLTSYGAAYQQIIKEWPEYKTKPQILEAAHVDKQEELTPGQLYLRIAESHFLSVPKK